nr:glycosyltransferase family 2 protein [uncultured Shinella sp.]
MTGPDVSIVIAAYNAADTIQRAIRSALAQQGVTVEVIVADDGSTDTTRATVAAFGDPAVRLLALDRNRGPGGARNAGFAAARGRWIAVLDADDTMQPGRLCRMISAAEHEDAALAVDNLFVLHLDGRIEAMFPDDLLARTPQITLPDFIDSNRIFRSTHNFGYMKPIFRRAFLEDNDLAYDEALRIGEDYLLFASALAAGGRCVVSPAAGYVYHIREGSISRVLHRHHVEAMLAGDQRFLARFPLTTGAAGSAQRRRTRNLQETRAFLALVQHLKNRSFGPALKVALGDPVALRHLAMPVAARWHRLVTPSHRKTVAPHAASSPATAQDLALKNKG